MHKINEKKSFFTALFYDTHPLGVKASMAFSCHDLGQTLVDCAKIEKKELYNCCFCVYRIRHTQYTCISFSSFAFSPRRLPQQYTNTFKVVYAGAFNFTLDLFLCSVRSLSCTCYYNNCYDFSLRLSSVCVGKRSSLVQIMYLCTNFLLPYFLSHHVLIFF